MTKNGQPAISVLNKSDIQLSVKFGFLGLGMGGSSIASACSDIQTNVTNNRFPYSSLLVNTNSIDLEKVKAKNPTTKKLVIGDGRGAGRNISKGKEMFGESYEVINEEFNKQFADRDFIWIVAGLGGGTGTGSVMDAIGLVHKSKFKGKFGLILTLPLDKDGDTVVQNAFMKLGDINKYMSALGSIILIDNQKLYNHFTTVNKTATIDAFLSYSNEYVADMLHELNTVTSSFTPFGSDHFDASEFENLIKTPGILHFARLTSKSTEVDSGQTTSYSLRLNERITDGVLSDGYDLDDTVRAAVSILANPFTSKRLYNMEFIEEINNVIDRHAPYAKEKPVATYTYPYSSNDVSYKDEVYFYAVFAGLGLPTRVGQLKNKLVESRDRPVKKKTETDLFGDLSGMFNTSTEPQNSLLDDLFSDSPSSNETAQDEHDSDAALFQPKHR